MQPLLLNENESIQMVVIGSAEAKRAVTANIRKRYERAARNNAEASNPDAAMCAAGCEKVLKNGDQVLLFLKRTQRAGVKRLLFCSAECQRQRYVEDATAAERGKLRTRRRKKYAV